MDETGTRGKQPVSAVLAGPYGHPFHPMLVTVPIGAWVASFVFDLASHVSSPAALATGAFWLIGSGWWAPWPRLRSGSSTCSRSRLERPPTAPRWCT